MLMTLSPSPIQLMQQHEPDLLAVGAYLDDYAGFRFVRRLDDVVYLSHEFDRRTMERLMRGGLLGLIAVEGRVASPVGDYWETL